MRRLITWNMMTLDGFFEGPNKWEIDWHEYVWNDELAQMSSDQSKEVGVLLFGRVTYEGMAAYWGTATDETAEFINAVPKMVFSRTLENAGGNNTRLVKGEAEAEVRSLK